MELGIVFDDGREIYCLEEIMVQGTLARRSDGRRRLSRRSIVIEIHQRQPKGARGIAIGEGVLSLKNRIRPLPREPEVGGNTPASPSAVAGKLPKADAP